MAHLRFNPKLQAQMDKAEYVETVSSIIHSYDNETIQDIIVELASYIVEYGNVETNEDGSFELTLSVVQ